ncbi:hypothetical protein sos41_35800 [Alphaproteobacteria bacterium SO-S41]|nr:hypothetical protein sos41_35800 [Alphaproteobacteria bacterium SO-S41]
MSAVERTRTYSWIAPGELSDAARNMTGLEFISRSLAGADRPAPIGATIDMRTVSVKEGEVVFSLVPQEFHYNPLGTVHGGILSTLLDSAAGCAVHTTLAKAQGWTSLTLEVKFIRAATAATGRLLCTGKVVNRGRQIATAEAEIRDEAGKLYATATTTCMIFAAPGAEAKA